MFFATSSVALATANNSNYMTPSVASEIDYSRQLTGFEEYVWQTKPPTRNIFQEVEEYRQEWFRSALNPDRVPYCTLNEFTLFPTLPVELRLKIWGIIIAQPRLIELESLKVPAGVDPRTFDHCGFRVAFPSLQLPRILHVCKESREEAKKSYRQITFTTFDTLDDPDVYYNPSADVIYFGPNACISNMVGLFQFGYKIPRVAIHLILVGKDCCDWHAGPGNQAVGLGVVGGIEILKALHSFDPDVVEGNTLHWPECSGIKDVFIVGNPMQTRTFASSEFAVFYSSLFTSPTQTAPVDESNGIMLEAGEFVSPEAAKKEALDRQLGRVGAGRGLEKVGRNKWLAGNTPVFR